MMARPGWFWVRAWTARHSLKLKAGGKGRAQGRPGRASAERSWRKTYCFETTSGIGAAARCTCRCLLGSESVVKKGVGLYA
jgi:hypothetical protein